LYARERSARDRAAGKTLRERETRETTKPAKFLLN